MTRLVFVHYLFATYLTRLRWPWTCFQMCVKILVWHCCHTPNAFVCAQNHPMWAQLYVGRHFTSLTFDIAVNIWTFLNGKMTFCEMVFIKCLRDVYKQCLLEHFTGMYQHSLRCFSNFLTCFPLQEKGQSPYLQDKIQCFNMVAILNMLNTTLDSSFSSLRRSLFIKLRRRERMCSPCFSAFTKHLGRILRNKWRGPVKKRR